MSGPAVLPPSTLKPVDAAAPAGKTRAQVEHTARQFETVFISQMLGKMFEGLETSGPFGGGAGEEAFRSFLVDAVAEQVSRAGGLGLADDLAREILKLQGLE